MSGKLRVLAALRSQGARGITRVDFQAPDVIDHGAPILNIPGRIYDLKKDGHEIIEEGRRNSCTIYRLLRDTQDAPPPPRAPSPAESLGSLFDPPSAPRSAIYGDDWDTAA